MKRLLAVVGQAVLFLLVAVVGLLWHPFHLVHVVSQVGYVRRQYEFDWLVCDTILFALLLLVGLLARRIRTSWVGTMAAFVLTVLIIVLFTKIGFRDVDLLTLR